MKNHKFDTKDYLHVSEWRPRVIALEKELTEARAEVERKDKIIIQMREALHAADIKLHGICLSCNKLIGMRSIKTLIKAALEAAGRGE